MNVIKNIEELNYLMSDIADWFYDKDTEKLSYYNFSDMNLKLHCLISRGAYKLMVETFKNKPVDKFVYCIFVSGLWQRTNKYAYDNLRDTPRVKIDAEYNEEALEICRYELHDDHEAVIEIL